MERRIIEIEPKISKQAKQIIRDHILVPYIKDKNKAIYELKEILEDTDVKLYMDLDDYEYLKDIYIIDFIRLIEI